MPLKVGIQLYSVRGLLQEDPVGTLRSVAETGYNFVEGANHDAAHDPGMGFKVPAGQMKDILEQYGLQLVGCHINPLLLEQLDDVLDYHEAIGNPQIGCDIEFFPYGDLDYLEKRCALFNEVGRMCRDRGMRFYYHNHYQEFQVFDGQYVYDLIMENTDPELVFLEMDTYWMLRAGQDPAECIKKYSDRLILLHQKDFPENAPQPLNLFDGVVSRDQNIDMDVFLETKDARCFTEIGTGVLPIQEIIDAAQSAPNLEYILLEQDDTQMDELSSIKTSMDAFRRYQGVSWT